MQTLHVFYQRLFRTEAKASRGMRWMDSHGFLQILGVPSSVDGEGSHQVGHLWAGDWSYQEEPTSEANRFPPEVTTESQEGRRLEGGKRQATHATQAGNGYPRCWVSRYRVDHVLYHISSLINDDQN